MKNGDIPRPCVCTSIRKAARVLGRTYDAALSSTGLNVTQLAVMRAVLRHPDEPLSRIAEDLAMDRTSLYRAVEGLARQQWLTLNDGKDKRSRRASVTKRGEAALSQADPGWSRTQGDIVGRFGHAEWQDFARELQRLINCASDIASVKPKPGIRL